MHLSLFLSPSFGDLVGVENGKGSGWTGRARENVLWGNNLKEFAQSLASLSVRVVKPVFAAWAMDWGDWMRGEWWVIRQVQDLPKPTSAELGPARPRVPRGQLDPAPLES